MLAAGRLQRREWARWAKAYERAVKACKDRAGYGRRRRYGGDGGMGALAFVKRSSLATIAAAGYPSESGVVAASGDMACLRCCGVVATGRTASRK